MAPSTETGSIALSVEIITIAAAPAAAAASATLTEPNTLVLTPSPQFASKQRHMLERRGVEHDVGLEVRHQAEDALAIADIGKTAFDLRPRLLGGKRFQHRVQRGLGILDHQQPRRAEGDDAIADFRADRAAAAGDDDRLALDEIFQPPVIDLHARPQQQILDIDRREPQRFAAFVERRQPARA